MIRKMAQADIDGVVEMMRVFYASDAVHTDGSEAIFMRDAEACVGEYPYLEGYVFTDGGSVVGYAMIAKSFSTEFGKPCVWIEDLYVAPPFRGRGLATEFLRFIDERYSDCVRRLEAEPKNARALTVYEKCGYAVLPYTELIKGTER